jgi:hypothetical protein
MRVRMKKSKMLGGHTMLNYSDQLGISKNGYFLFRRLYDGWKENQQA